MLARVIMTFLVFAATPAFAIADPQEDARIIAEITQTEETFSAAMDSLSNLMSATIQNEMHKAGKTISPDAARVYAQMLGTSLTEGMMTKMKKPMIDAYIANLSPEALHAYRLFLETDEGREIAATQTVMMQEGVRIGESVGEKVALGAVGRVTVKIADNEWPADTPPAVQAELKQIFLGD